MQEVAYRKGPEGDRERERERESLYIYIYVCVYIHTYICSYLRYTHNMYMCKHPYLELLPQRGSCTVALAHTISVLASVRALNIRTSHRVSAVFAH